MSYETVKRLAKRLGLYGSARWFYRHVMNREDLRSLLEDVAFYRQFVGPGDLCFDVGANYGTKSEALLKLGARVVAFEPQPDCAREMLDRIGPDDRFVLLVTAVGSAPGRAMLTVDAHRTASSLVESWRLTKEGTIEVPVTTLDEAIAKYGVPKLCKIDVEGFELEVLKGLSRAVPIVSYEYHMRTDGVLRRDRIDRALECLDRLARFGEISVNVTPAEKPVLARAEWFDRREFADFFRERMPEMPGYAYGDIIVKTR